MAIGEVADTRLSERGVEVILDIEGDAPPMPADTAVNVANRSAAGEQYVDLVPRREGEPYLADGAVIPQERTSIPLAPGTVLSNLDQLVASVDTRSLRTVVDETYHAFVGAGPGLQQLLDTASSFTANASEHLPETRTLLSDESVVLETQQRQGERIVALSNGLRTVADRLKKADADLRRVIDEAPKLSREASSVLAESGTDLGVVMANLADHRQDHHLPHGRD